MDAIYVPHICCLTHFFLLIIVYAVVIRVANAYSSIIIQHNSYIVDVFSRCFACYLCARVVITIVFVLVLFWLMFFRQHRS